MVLCSNDLIRSTRKQTTSTMQDEPLTLPYYSQLQFLICLIAWDQTWCVLGSTQTINLGFKTT